MQRLNVTMDCKLLTAFHITFYSIATRSDNRLNRLGGEVVCYEERKNEIIILCSDKVELLSIGIARWIDILPIDNNLFLLTMRFS